MERIKNFHIFDKSLPVSLTDIANRIFVCVVLYLIFSHLYLKK